MGGELVTHLPLVGTAKLAMRRQPPPPPPPPPQPPSPQPQRPALRTSRVSTTEISSCWHRGTTTRRQRCTQGHQQVSQSAPSIANCACLAGPRRLAPAAGCWLQTQRQAAKHWPIVESHCQPKLPAEIDASRIKETQHDSDREQKKRVEGKALGSPS